jgi:hypothetical protein
VNLSGNPQARTTTSHLNRLDSELLMPPASDLERSSGAFHTAFTGQVCKLKALALVLPDNVPLATEKDRINEVFTKFPSVAADDEDYWLVFNRRMDALFGEDVRNSDGRLQHVMRGPFGMDMVVPYLEEAIVSGQLQWAAAQPKFTRLVDELQHLVYVCSFKSEFCANTILLCYRDSGRACNKNQKVILKLTALNLAAKRKPTASDEDDGDYKPLKRH